MPLKHLTTQFKELADETSNRFDVDFIDFQHNFLLEKYYSFNELFEINKNNKKDITELDDSFYYVEIGNVDKQGDVIPVELNFNERNIEDEGYYKKIEKGDITRVEEDEILISKVRPNLRKYVFVNKENKKYFYTSAFLNLKPKKINKILYYALRTVFYNNLLAISRQGKGYPTVKEDDLLYLKFDRNIIHKLESNKKVLNNKIEKIEKIIRELKEKIENPQKVINEVFVEEFKFDHDLYKKFGKGMTAGTQKSDNKKLRIFNINFKEFNRSKILRFSTRFHNEPTRKLMDIVNKIDRLDVCDIVENYEKGVQPKYNKDGEVPVVKIANLKNNYIDLDNAEFVTYETYKKLDSRGKLKKGDIVICATGKVSLGKIDLYNNDDKAIFTVDSYKIKLNNKYNPLFFIYFFRSILGFFQIERDYTGTTNQIHLYWNEISNFQIPDISLPRQQKIVDKIKSRLDKQEEIKQKIKEERNKIDEIIEECIK